MDGGDVVGVIVNRGRCVVVIRVSTVRVRAAFVAVTVALGPIFVNVKVLGRCSRDIACVRHFAVRLVVLGR